jgi:hypothetical protein
MPNNVNVKTEAFDRMQGRIPGTIKIEALDGLQDHVPAIFKVEAFDEWQGGMAGLVQ